MNEPAKPPAAPGTRRKTITWEDPLLTARAGADLPGLEFLGRVAAGEIPPPPIARLMGFDLGELAEGVAEFVGTPDESVYNPIGMVHGGYVCTMLDSALGCAVHTTLPAGVAYTSIEIKVNYLRPAHADVGELRVRGRVTKAGRRVAFAEGDVRDAAGRVLATAQSSLLIIAPA
ncbi:PaaI family thioesterase [Patulibacter minatonensis]|uniref:PaaI family thioesterase n=1 Tax=Patulibacter minatonensis TaxID=298163 RepID=UPI00047BC222|nr:PaaI family thioesterase [Patulibacter minatonensis]